MDSSTFEDNSLSEAEFEAALDQLADELAAECAGAFGLCG